MDCKICGCPDARWLRVRTVARQFRCSAKKVRRLILRGELEGLRLGGEWRVDHLSLDRFVQQHSQDPDESDGARVRAVAGIARRSAVRRTSPLGKKGTRPYPRGARSGTPRPGKGPA